MNTQIDIPIAPAMKPIWETDTTFYAAYGGRGGSKSFFFADKLIVDALTLPPDSLLLSCREYQNSIEESNKKAIELRIVELGLEDHFDMQKQVTICRHNRNSITYAGLKQNASKVLSKVNLKRIHVDEAAFVSLNSIRLLLPTISRNKGIKLYFSWNPRSPDDPVHQMFVTGNDDPKNTYPYWRGDDACVVWINWEDNPWLNEDENPEWFKELRTLYKNDPEEARCIYGGLLWTRQDALVYKRGHWKIDDDIIAPSHAKDYMGIDFGDTNPTAIVKMKIWDKTILIEDETHETRVNPDDLHHLIAAYEGAAEGRYRITADSNMPGVIRMLREDSRYNFDIHGAKKTPDKLDDTPYFNSYVKQQIYRLKGYSIHVRSHCTHTIKEFETYSYEVDPDTEKVTQRILKANDHHMDAMKYGAEPELSNLYPMALVSGIG